MATNPQSQTPVHLWIVGVLSLLWAAFGCLDYTMTNLKNAAWLAQMTPDQIAYIDSLPSWLTAFWAFGVWGGLVGSVLLLMRNRRAVWAFAVSCIGAIVGLGYQIALTKMPASMKEGIGGYLPWIIILITIFQVWYAWTQEKKGVLR